MTRETLLRLLAEAVRRGDRVAALALAARLERR